MAMKLVKKTNDYSIYRRGDDRYAIRDAHKKPVNGDEKVRILVEEGLVKVAVPAAPAAAAEEPAASEEGAGEEAATEAGAGEGGETE